MGTPLRVLMVEDSEPDARLLVREIRKGGYDPAYERVDYAETMRAALTRQPWDVVLTDYRMPHFNGMEALRVLQEAGPDVPLIVVSGAIGEETAADLMRAGAHDFIRKDNLSRLVPAIQRELREAVVRQERRRAEAELHSVNRGLRVLSSVNEALIRASTEQELLESAVRIAVEVGGYRMVWVGFAEDDPEKTVRPVCHAGYEEGYLDAVRVSWADNALGRGPTGIAIRTGQPAFVRDIGTAPEYAPWREEALKRGYASSIALPLSADGHAFGALNLYRDRPNAFVTEEVNLLREMAGDLAYGIQALRTRAERKQAEEALEAAHQRLLQSETEKRRFFSEVIRAVTHDKFHLVVHAEIPTQGHTVLYVPLDSPESYRALRARLKEIATAAGMDPKDADDLVLAVAEAATNAIKHAGGGCCELCQAADRLVARVSDHGKGIRPEDLPRTIFVPGFSTKVSLGMGYTLMLELVDDLWLATGPAGTVVQLEKWIHPEKHVKALLPTTWERL